MICYKDMTFCPYWQLCRDGHTCGRALTNKILNDANKWWGKDGAPIAVYTEFPECFVRWFEAENTTA